MKFLEYQTLEQIGSKAVCGFDLFVVSPKGTEAKEESNLLAFLKFSINFAIDTKHRSNSFSKFLILAMECSIDSENK